MKTLHVQGRADAPISHAGGEVIVEAALTCGDLSEPTRVPFGTFDRGVGRKHEV
jgi:hypothetical protein